jgi:hypothetical protein
MRGIPWHLFEYTLGSQKRSNSAFEHTLGAPEPKPSHSASLFSLLPGSSACCLGGQPGLGKPPVPVQAHAGCNGEHNTVKNWAQLATMLSSARTSCIPSAIGLECRSCCFRRLPPRTDGLLHGFPAYVSLDLIPDT